MCLSRMDIRYPPGSTTARADRTLPWYRHKLKTDMNFLRVLRHLVRRTSRVSAGLLVLIAGPLFRPSAWAQELAPFSLSISPDGHWLAFGRSNHASGDLSFTFAIRDLTSGTTTPIATYSYGNPNFGPRAVWSPDSRFLAYYAVVDEALQLEIWDRAHARLLHPGVWVSRRGLAEVQMPEWTADGRSVLVLSDTGKPPRMWEEQEGDNYVARLRAELIGQTPARGGVTVLGTSALDAAVAPAFTRVGTTASPSASVARRIVAVSVTDGSQKVIANGAEYEQLQTGAGLVLAGVDGPDGYAVSVIPLSGAMPRSLFTAPTQNFNLSPSGKSVAYLDERTRDVFVVDVATGAKRSLTESVAMWTVSTPDSVLQRVAGRFDLPLSKAKFGSSAGEAPLWTADESAVIIRRAIPRLSVAASQRVELWRLPLGAGSPNRVIADTTISLTSVADCHDRTSVNCLDAQGNLVAWVRMLKPGYAADSLGYARIDPKTGTVKILRWMRSATTSDLQVARRTGDIVGVEESADRAPDLWRVTGANATPLHLLTDSLAPPSGEVRRLQWMSASGDSIFAVLRLPADLATGERPPVILDLYPGRVGLSSSRHFAVNRLEPLRARGRFAILTLDMPVQFGSGHVCADLSRFAVEALDAAIATGRIDGNRAGVTGISYGGYSVNCVITHTNRFKAAVSEVGPSDLASTHALGGRGEWNVTKSWQWETPQKLVDESPAYHLDRVSTPVLFFTGKTDLVNALQEYEMFFGLQALGKPAALAAYDGAGHGDYDRFPDYWPRVLQWYATYLRAR